MIALTRLVMPASSSNDEGAQALLELARPAVQALAGCAGFLRASFARAADDPQICVLLSEWADVGSYRRALSSYDVRMHATPLFGHATQDPGAYEELLWASAEGVSGDGAAQPAGSASGIIFGEAGSDRS